MWVAAWGAACAGPASTPNSAIRAAMKVLGIVRAPSARSRGDLRAIPRLGSRADQLVGRARELHPRTGEFRDDPRVVNRQFRLSPMGAIVLYGAALAGVAAALFAAVVHGAEPLADPHLPWWAIAI